MKKMSTKRIRRKTAMLQISTCNSLTFYSRDGLLMISDGFISVTEAQPVWNTKRNQI